MAFMTPVAVHKDEWSMKRGKRVDASLFSPFTENETSFSHKGKGAQMVKSALTQPGKAVRQERKALRDLTNAATQPKPSAKDKTAPLSRVASKKKAPKDDKIELWAAEGIEKMDYFDVKKFETDRARDWCFSEILPVPSSLPPSPRSEVLSDSEDILEAELEEKVHLPRRLPRPSTIMPSILDDEDYLQLYCEDLYFNKKDGEEGSVLMLKEEEF